MNARLQGLFVTGTDTEIGKTCVTAGLTHALAEAGARVAPVKSLAAGQLQDASGQWVNEDVQLLHAAQRLGLSPAQVGPVQFREPCAPHIAARLEGKSLEREPLLTAIRASAQLGELALVEGVGGFRVPLNDAYDTADLAVDLALPVLLVVGLRLAGWVANTADPQQPHVADNVAALAARLGVPCWGQVPRLTDPSPAAVAAHFSLTPAALLQAVRQVQEP